MFRLQKARQLSSPLFGIFSQPSLVPGACVNAIEDWRLAFRTSFGTTAQVVLQFAMEWEHKLLPHVFLSSLVV